jgi:glycosyltransferase involved in cell wall biosynthesis
MDRKNKRILWLINHQTLMEFEPALLENLGYEVYIPKLFPQSAEFRSAAVTDEFDSHLTIPAEALELLNNFNFYTTRMPPKIRHIVNTYFRIAFVIPIPIQLEQVFQHFEGHIILHAFGLVHTSSYDRVLTIFFGEGVRETIARLGSRFHFGIAYQNIAEAEPDYLRSREMFLPIGVPPRFFSHGDVWKGDDKRLFFICPAIKENPYYANVYREFKKDFNDIPHVIGGWQSKEINDPAIIGGVDRVKFDDLLCNLRVMYYHSHEPHHVHYHPLEAMAMGMPVVFMQEGMLGQIDKNGNQPGACKTISEARKKIRRILDGDNKFAHEIRSAQKRLLIPFTYAYCFTEWQKNFIPAMQEKPVSQISEVKRIAVMLPLQYKSGTFDAAKAIAKMIHHGSRKAGTPVDVIFSFLRGHYDLTTDFEDLNELGIQLRETEWHKIDRGAVERILRMDGQLTDLEYPEYFFPRDGMRDFLDADWWLIVSDSLSYPPAPLRNYGVVIHDCLSRYFKEYQNPPLMNARTGTARGAAFVFATTPQTREDIISYHGISADRVILAPIEFSMDFDTLTQIQPPVIEPYFVWSTNSSPHKNQVHAAEGLIRYYAGGGKLDTVITGFDIEQFDTELIDDDKITLPNVAAFRKKIQTNKKLKEHVIICPNLPKQEYLGLLKGASFVWHPALLDNGTFTVVEAAAHGTPGLSADYPQMRYIDNYFGLNLMFFDPRSPTAIADALHHMEKESKTRKALLPSIESLRKSGWKELAERYWHLLEEVL